MKLFIWAEPYPVSWGSSMLIVAADTEEEARQKASDGTAFTYGRFKKEGIPMSAKEISRLPEPDRVLEMPCAEWHRWEE